MASPKITAIGEGDLQEVSTFLNEHLNARISASAWKQSLIHPWCADRPNYGAQMRDGSNLVGVFCAIYSDQEIEGRPETFCNPHSWCVLPEYRQQGIGLVLHLIRQPGYHFAMLTPNPKVAEIFIGLRFKLLDDALLVFPNFPSLALLRHPRDRFVESDVGRIGEHLSQPTLRDFELHKDIPWLRFVAFGSANDVCLVAYKRSRRKRLPCARLMYISDASAFDRHASLLQHHLLTREGLVICEVEGRFVKRAPKFSFRLRRTQPKLFLSRSLTDSNIRDVYTELVALDV
jgi:hypothetical protein